MEVKEQVLFSDENYILAVAQNTDADNEPIEGERQVCILNENGDVFYHVAYKENNEYSTYDDKQTAKAIEYMMQNYYQKIEELEKWNPIIYRLLEKCKTYERAKGLDLETYLLNLHTENKKLLNPLQELPAITDSEHPYYSGRFSEWADGNSFRPACKWKYDHPLKSYACANSKHNGDFWDSEDIPELSKNAKIRKCMDGDCPRIADFHNYLTENFQENTLLEQLQELIKTSKDNDIVGLASALKCALEGKEEY